MFQTKEQQNEWPLGIIEETVESEDASVRTVKVRMSNGEIN